MIKNSLKTLQEKYGNTEHDNSNDLAKFMKRRRLEQNRTLEDVSRGICSPSYLSKIENCQVDVDSYYFQSLFEKLDLKYESVKKERQNDFFSKIVKYYLLERYDLLENKLKQMVNGSSYCDTELELIVLLHNIIKKNYDEAGKLITKLEDVRNTLTKEELYLLSFLITLYLYSTNQYVLAAEQIEILYKHPSENMYYNIAVSDLGIDIYFFLGKESMFFKYYQKLKQYNNQELYNTRILIHNIQVLVLQARNGNSDVIEDLEVQLLAARNHHLDEEKIVYNEALVYYYLNNYSKVIDLVNTIEPSVKILALEGMILNKINDFDKSVKFLNKLKSVEICFKSNDVFGNYIEYIREKFEQYSYTKILAFLKNVVLPNVKENYVFWLYEEEKQEYLMLCFELGKYKEAIRFMIKMGELGYLKKN